jgi:hypothetical protein
MKLNFCEACTINNGTIENGRNSTARRVAGWIFSQFATQYSERGEKEQKIAAKMKNRLADGQARHTISIN